jgi:Glycosyl transferase family 2
VGAAIAHSGWHLRAVSTDPLSTINRTVDTSPTADDRGMRILAVTRPTTGTSLNLRSEAEARSLHEAVGLAQSTDPHQTPYLVIISGDAVTSADLADQVRAAVTDPALGSVRWLALLSDGVDVSGAYVDHGNYLEDPVTPAAAPLRAAAWADPALCIIDVERLGALDSTADLGDFGDLVAAAARAHWASIITPRLRFSSLGDSRSLADRPQTSVATPTSRAAWLGKVRPEPSLTVAVRTTGTRRGMLRRNLEALGAAHRHSPVADVVLVGRDIESAAVEASRSIELPTRRVDHADDDRPPRVAAMTAALEESDTDYVWFVDDDDWVTPASVAVIKSAVHASDRPIVIAASDVFAETWEDDDLVAAVEERHYWPGEWYRAFTGWNFLPFCSIVLPRELAMERLLAIPVRHDLGEDYAMQLLLFTAAGSTVAVAEETIANVSIRGASDNVVTMTDRTPWLRDFASHASDLSEDPMASTAAFWALGRAVRGLPYPPQRQLDDPDAGDAPAEGTADRLRARAVRALNRLIRPLIR